MNLNDRRAELGGQGYVKVGMCKFPLGEEEAEFEFMSQMGHVVTLGCSSAAESGHGSEIWVKRKSESPARARGVLRRMLRWLDRLIAGEAHALYGIYTDGNIVPVQRNGTAEGGKRK